MLWATFQGNVRYHHFTDLADFFLKCVLSKDLKKLITLKSQERKKQMEERQEKKKKQKLSRQLGKTVNGEW